VLRKLRKHWSQASERLAYAEKVLAIPEALGTTDEIGCLNQLTAVSGRLAERDHAAVAEAWPRLAMTTHNSPQATGMRGDPLPPESAVRYGSDSPSR
jgi:hypothetical protein